MSEWLGVSVTSNWSRLNQISLLQNYCLGKSWAVLYSGQILIWYISTVDVTADSLHLSLAIILRQAFQAIIKLHLVTGEDFYKLVMQYRCAFLLELSLPAVNNNVANVMVLKHKLCHLVLKSKRKSKSKFFR